MKSLLVLIPLSLAACSTLKSSDTPPPPQAIAGNIGGVYVSYDGSTGGLREADMVASHHCERYQRKAALVNDAPATAGGSIAYYYCQ